MKNFKFLVMAVCCGTFMTVAGAGADDDEEGDRRIEVSGVGSVSSKPDLALASLGVRTFARSVQQAVVENNATAESILFALRVPGSTPIASRRPRTTCQHNGIFAATSRTPLSAIGPTTW